MKYKFFAFLICIVVSFALWYLISYSQKEAIAVTLSVQTTGCSMRYILVEKSNKEITFQAQSFLHDLNKIRKKDKLVIDLNDIQIEKIKGRYQGVLPVEPYLQKFLRQINYNGHFDVLTPDTIVFFFEIPVKKEVPVSLDIQYTIADQYQQCVSTATSPQTVLIEGIKRMVDTIRTVKTYPVRLGTIKDTFNQMVALEKYPSLRLSHDSVHVLIPVTEFIEKEKPTKKR